MVLIESSVNEEMNKSSSDALFIRLF